MAGLVFCKSICTFISGNSGFIKEDVGLGVMECVRKNFEDVSLNMVTVLLYQQLLPNLI